MKTHPKWATKHRRKGTELRLINNNYYLYEVSSKWDTEKKRAKKVTGKILGKITKELGFVESDKAKLRKRELIVSKLSVKEYGIYSFISSHLSEYKTLLQKHFPNQWQAILSLAYGRLVHQSALKNMEFHYLQSYLSEEYPNLSLSPKTLTSLLREIGVNRKSIISFFKEFNKAKDNILFDGTDLLSNSQKMDVAKLSKTKSGTFDTMANIMFIFSVGLQLPVYYRIVPGSIKDIKSFKLCLEESKIKDAVLIADKGFYSESNIKQINQQELKYIIPLRRNNLLINYDNTKTSEKNNYDGYFKYEGRIIWYYTVQLERENIIVYLDDELKAQEIKDYLTRIDSLPEDYTISSFHQTQHTFGTIALMNNLEKHPKDVFADYKSRGQVEGMIDILKNIIDADRSYMQNENALEAWMFINYIALHWYFRIYQILVKHELNKKYAPMDFIGFLREIKKVKINDQWHTAEITAKTKSIIDMIGCNIT